MFLTPNDATNQLFIIATFQKFAQNTYFKTSKRHIVELCESIQVRESILVHLHKLTDHGISV